jgi:hypothetical protein
VENLFSPVWKEQRNIVMMIPKGRFLICCKIGALNENRTNMSRSIEHSSSDNIAIMYFSLELFIYYLYISIVPAIVSNLLLPCCYLIFFGILEVLFIYIKTRLFYVGSILLLKNYFCERNFPLVKIPVGKIVFRKFDRFFCIASCCSKRQI